MTESLVTIRFFASLRETVGFAECQVNAKNLSDVLTALQKRMHPAAFTEITAENVRIAINADMIEGNPELHAGDEIAFLPPVTGG